MAPIILYVTSPLIYIIQHFCRKLKNVYDYRKLKTYIYFINLNITCVLFVSEIEELLMYLI